MLRATYNGTFRFLTATTSLSSDWCQSAQLRQEDNCAGGRQNRPKTSIASTAYAENTTAKAANTLIYQRKHKNRLQTQPQIVAQNQ